MPKKAYSVSYEARFGTAIPVAGFPLPIPVALPAGVHAKWWTDLLDYAEAYVWRPREKLTSIPKKFWNAGRKGNAIVAALAADVYVGMDFYARWVGREAEEEADEGMDTIALAQKERDSVLEAVRLARSGDWAQFVKDEYLDSLQRCRWLCDATRRGHGAEVGEPLSFRKGDVEKVMKETDGFVGIIDYSHVRKIVLMEVTDV